MTLIVDYPLAPGAYEYRPLFRQDPALSGWDVYAVQSLLTGSGAYEGQLDGVFGDATAVAVWRYQRARGILQDGRVGPQTLRYLVLDQIHGQTRLLEIPQGLMRGHILQESSFLPGNYTAPYANGNRDLGVVMRNRPVTPENKLAWFDAVNAIGYMYGDPQMGVRPVKNRYIGKPGAPTHERAWKLAVAHWNAPSVADSVAAGKYPAPDWMERYIVRCTGYVKEWTP